MPILNHLSVPTEGGSLNTINPKLKFRFRVKFIDLGGSANTDVITREVISVTRPNIQFEPITLDVYNSKIFLAGKHTWQPITIEFRDDVESATTQLLDQQVARQIDMATQSSPRAGQSYKFSIDIDNLDGGNPTPGIFDTWHLYGCFVTDINYNDSNYSSGSEFQNITLSVQFDNAEHEIIDKVDDSLKIANEHIPDLINATV